jgi:hypothetical protein
MRFWNNTTFIRYVQSKTYLKVTESMLTKWPKQDIQDRLRLHIPEEGEYSLNYI